LVLLVGIFGNISHDDLARTIAAAEYVKGFETKGF